jgi:type IV pilus assembly protein PilB
MLRKLLGESLIESGLISSEQLSLALREQLKSKQRLGHILVNMGFISTDTLIEFLARQRGARGVNLYKESIDENVSRFIQGQYINGSGFLPLGFIIVGEIHKLVVATADPENSGLADKLTFSTGCEIELVYSREEDIEWVLQSYGRKRRKWWSSFDLRFFFSVICLCFN